MLSSFVTSKRCSNSPNLGIWFCYQVCLRKKKYKSKITPKLLNLTSLDTTIPPFLSKPQELSSREIELLARWRGGGRRPSVRKDGEKGTSILYNILLFNQALSLSLSYLHSVFAVLLFQISFLNLSVAAFPLVEYCGRGNYFVFFFSFSDWRSYR